MRKPRESVKIRTTIGGQALIEGIMMRGPAHDAIVVRTHDELTEKVEARRLIKDRFPILGWPLIRGVVNFGSSMATGVRAIFFAADLMIDDDSDDSNVESSALDQWIERKFGQDERGKKVLTTVTAVFSFAFSIALFVLLPTLVAGLFSRLTDSHLLRNALEGVLRIAIFVSFLGLVSRMPDIRRTYMYHGAEHKTIFCYEKQLPLTVENVRTQPREHPRCGTSFLFVVMIVSIAVFSVVTWSNPLIRIALRLALLPVVVAISYEFNRIVGRYDNVLTRALSWPGRALQKMTVFEPDDDMIEVAIRALTLVIPSEEGADRW
ncbi:MAG: DUF1385 domain-containing protein [Oscillospiraceae bacterium]|jgi:uncharacterized protein YqhQ|nr:DUF1385 domain-containing protein [Oscillospiraceae bacterium]